MPLNFDDPEVKTKAKANAVGFDRPTEIQRQYEAGKRCLRLRSLKNELSDVQHKTHAEREQTEAQKAAVAVQVAKLEAAYRVEHAKYQEAARQLQGCNIRDTINRARALTEERDARERVIRHATTALAARP